MPSNYNGDALAKRLLNLDWPQILTLEIAAMEHSCAPLTDALPTAFFNAA